MPIIEEIGQALYGPQWKVGMEQLLGVGDRTLRRWMADPSLIPDNVKEELHALCSQRVMQLQSIMARLNGEREGFQREVRSEMRKPTPRRRDEF